MRQLIMLATALAALAACSSDGTTADARRDVVELTRFQPAGEPVSCIQISRIRHSRVLSDQVIDFELTGGGRLRNTLSSSCPSLGFEERFSYRTTINQLCSGDIITVLQQPGLSGGPSCVLSRFQPVERAPG